MSECFFSNIFLVLFLLLSQIKCLWSLEINEIYIIWLTEGLMHYGHRSPACLSKEPFKKTFLWTFQGWWQAIHVWQSHQHKHPYFHPPHQPHHHHQQLLRPATAATECQHQQCGCLPRVLWLNPVLGAGVRRWEGVVLLQPLTAGVRLVWF